MTRLRSEDIEHILPALETYDEQLRNKTGNTLKGIACHALGLAEYELENIVKSHEVCVIPLTCGQGIIDCFCATVSGIISYLGFHSLVAGNPDVAGITEALTRKSDIVLLADDQRFVAINVHTKYISDNIEMTARGFVAGLDLMANGLKGKETLVIGCGELGRHTVKTLIAMGGRVSVCDINPQLAVSLQEEILEELKIPIQVDNDWRSTPGKYQQMIDATPSPEFIDASMITRDTHVAVPGVPCGLSSEARNRLSNRYLHDPLQIGVATMVIDAASHG